MMTMMFEYSDDDDILFSVWVSDSGFAVVTTIHQVLGCFLGRKKRTELAIVMHFRSDSGATCTGEFL